MNVAPIICPTHITLTRAFNACIIYDNRPEEEKGYTVKEDKGTFGLSNVAATMVNLMGYEAPAMWDESIIK